MKLIILAIICSFLMGCAPHYSYLRTANDFTAGVIGGIGAVELETAHNLRKGEFKSEGLVFVHAWLAITLFYANPIVGGIYLGISGLYSSYRIGIHAKNCKYHQQ